MKERKEEAREERMDGGREGGKEVRPKAPAGFSLVSPLKPVMQDIFFLMLFFLFLSTDGS